MSYKFESTESVRGAFGRCAHEELDRALQELTDGAKVDPVSAVHEARKALKMERALLRLAHGSLKPGTRRRENQAMRDAARRLSGARDADVMIEAVDALAERYAGQVPEASFNTIRAHFEAGRDRARAQQAAFGEIEAAVAELSSVRHRADGWRLSDGGWGALEPGLRRGYARGRKAFAQARRQPTAENLHEWRKRAKDLWYHLRLLEPAAPHILGGAVAEAHELTDLLGDDHDLVVLDEQLRAASASLAIDLDPVLALIAHRRNQLREQAWPQGERVYAERPQAFTRRLHRYWRAARTQARAVQELRSRPGDRGRARTS